MRAALALPAALLVAATGPATHRYAIDAASSDVSAKVAFFGLASKTARFPKMTGSITLSPTNPRRMDLQVTLDGTALIAPDSVTLARLKGPDFFDVGRHPTVVFEGREMVLKDKTSATVLGQVTARGVTRPASLAVTFDTPPGKARGTKPLSLTAITTIDRRDFGMTAYPLIVGRKVTVRIRARMVPN